MKVILAIIMLLTLFVTTVKADIVSVNNGGDNQVVITPGGAIESFFTGLTPQSAGGGGGGAVGRAEVPGLSITVIPKNPVVVQDNALPFDIIFSNNEKEETDVVLRYYFQKVTPLMGGFVTQIASEKVELAKKLPLGNYTITRSILAPSENVTEGNWSLIVEFKSRTRDLRAETFVGIVKSIWPAVQYFLIFIVLFTVLTWYLLIYRRRKDDRFIVVSRRDEDDDEKNR